MLQLVENDYLVSGFKRVNNQLKRAKCPTFFSVVSVSVSGSVSVEAVLPQMAQAQFRGVKMPTRPLRENFTVQQIFDCVRENALGSELAELLLVEVATGLSLELVVLVVDLVAVGELELGLAVGEGTVVPVHAVALEVVLAQDGL